jgi:hypothetical protein
MYVDGLGGSPRDLTMVPKSDDVSALHGLDASDLEADNRMAVTVAVTAALRPADTATSALNTGEADVVGGDTGDAALESLFAALRNDATDIVPAPDHGRQSASPPMATVARRAPRSAPPPRPLSISQDVGVSVSPPDSDSDDDLEYFSSPK